MKNISTRRHNKSRKKSNTEKPSASSNNKLNLSQTRNWQLQDATIKQSLLKNVDYSFNISDKVRRNIHLIQRKVHSTAASKSYGVTRISINGRITERINSGQSDNPVLGWSLLHNNHFISSSATQIFKNRFVRMANTRSKANHPFPNISITLDQMLKIRKKRLNKKLKESILANKIIPKFMPVELPKDTNLKNTGNIATIVSNVGQNNCDDCPCENSVNINQNNNCTAQDESKKNGDVTNLSIQTGIIEKCSTYQVGNDVKQNEEIIDLVSDNSPINLTVSEASEAQNLTEVNEDVIIDLDIDDYLTTETFSKTNIDEKLQQSTFFNCNSNERASATDKNFNNNDMKNTNKAFIKNDPAEVIEDDIEDAVIFFTLPPIPKNVEKTQTQKEDFKTKSNHGITLTSTPKPIGHSNIETIITSRETLSNNMSHKRTERTLSSTSSVIEIPDSPDVSADIIFISEKKFSSTPCRKRKKVNEEPLLIIVDDDEDDSNCKLISVDKVKNACKVKKYSTRVQKFKKKKKRNVAKVSSVATSSANIGKGGELPSKVCELPSKVFAIPSLAVTNAPVVCDTFTTHPQSSDRILQLLPQSSSNNIALPYVGSTEYFLGNNISNTGSIRREGLREIIIDGSNVALGHTNGALFSVEGLRIAIYHFTSRGHKVTAFVPQYRVKYGMCSNPQLLNSLNKQRLVIFTPSREVHGKRITPYDDRYIIQYATACEGIVVSNDNYRDLLIEKPEWGETIARRLLMYTWVDNVLMFPEDPLGRFGPRLSRFLRFP